VVVVNHALLLADAFNESPSASRARHLILDEAHHLEEAATKGLTEEIREDDLLGQVGIAGSGRGVSAGVAELDGAVRDLFEALRGACRYIYGSELGRDLRLNEAGFETPAMAGVLNAVSRVSAALRCLPVSAAAVVEARILRLVELTSRPDSGQVTWVGFGRDGRSTIRRAPLDVGPLLADAIFEDRDSVILTSATLSLNGSFDYFRSADRAERLASERVGAAKPV